MTFVPKVCPKGSLTLSEKSDSLVGLSVVIKDENAICLTVSRLRVMTHGCVICDRGKKFFKRWPSQGRKTGILSIIFKESTNMERKRMPLADSRNKA